MKEAPKKIVLYSIAGLLILILIQQMTINILGKVPLAIFWSCYIFMILVPIGIFLKKPKLILSQIAIMLIPSFLWIIDLTYALITKKPLIGLIGNIFSNGKIIFSGLIHLYHALIVPLAIIALIIMKPKKTNGYIKISFIQIAILSVLGLTIPQLYGINCFPGPEMCTDMALQYSPLYPIIYLLILTIAILVSSLIIDYFLKKSK